MEIFTNRETSAFIPNEQKKVLYIEDNFNNMDIVRKVVENMGINFYWSLQGYQGIEDTHRLKPNVILIDMDLPGISGLEVIKRLRSQNGIYYSNVPIVAITGKARYQGIRKKLMNAGCDVLIEKPVNLRELCALVETIG